MTLLDRRSDAEIIEDQRIEIAQLKRDNGFVITDTEAAKLRNAFSLTAQQAWILHAIHRRGARGLTVEHAIAHMPCSSDPLDRETKLIRVQVSKIRAHVGFDAIDTIWGTGYRITDKGRAKVQEALG